MMSRQSNSTGVMKKPLLVLLICLFTVMIGFGITLPVLPFYTERLTLAEGASRDAVAMHVGALTSVYVLMQLFFAPLWGRLSDRIGRRPMVLTGIAGYAIAQLLFGVATSLNLLYGARILGGILSSATLPAATAFVADTTTEEERARGMAWLGASVSLGVVVGPSLGGALARTDLHFSLRYGHFMIDSFSVPFFAAAALAILVIPVAVRWLPESLPSHTAITGSDSLAVAWSDLGRRLKPLLGLALAGQFGLAMFETTFALYALEILNYGPAQLAAVFTVCGLVMAVFQIGATGYLAKRVSEIQQIAFGFILMGGSLAMLLLVRRTALVLGVVGLVALGMAFITPNLLALISKRSGESKGAALGIQNATNSLGQAGGPMLGVLLFAWYAGAPFLLVGVFLVGIGIPIGWRTRARRSRNRERFAESERS
ncbi:MAG: MFS transporter [Blastocatellia bacterium]|nr:MFS transporter [Blastocatellia bacterium]